MLLKPLTFLPLPRKKTLSFLNQLLRTGISKPVCIDSVLLGLGSENELRFPKSKRLAALNRAPFWNPCRSTLWQGAVALGERDQAIDLQVRCCRAQALLWGENPIVSVLWTRWTNGIRQLSVFLSFPAFSRPLGTCQLHLGSQRSCWALYRVQLWGGNRRSCVGTGSGFKSPIRLLLRVLHLFEIPQNPHRHRFQLTQAK